MNNKYVNNYIRKFFFIAIAFLYLMASENDSVGFANYSISSNAMSIELEVQPDSPDDFQLYKEPTSLSKRKEYKSFYLVNIFKSRKKILLSTNYFLNGCFNNQQRYYSSFHHIISILQKNNTWHRSSDDDPRPYDYC